MVIICLIVINGGPSLHGEQIRSFVWLFNGLYMENHDK